MNPQPTTVSKLWSFHKGTSCQNVPGRGNVADHGDVLYSLADCVRSGTQIENIIA